jgi:hypothetical protein
MNKKYLILEGLFGKKKTNFPSNPETLKKDYDLMVKEIKPLTQPLRKIVINSIRKNPNLKKKWQLGFEIENVYDRSFEDYDLIRYNWNKMIEGEDDNQLTSMFDESWSLISKVLIRKGWKIKNKDKDLVKVFGGNTYIFHHWSGDNDGTSYGASRVR